MQKSRLGYGFLLLFTVLPSISYALDTSFIRCTGQVRRQYRDSTTVSDSTGLPVAVVGSKTFQEDLRRVAVAADGEVMELSYENVATRGIRMRMKGQRWFHFDGGYAACVKVNEGSLLSDPTVTVSLRQKRNGVLQVLGVDTVELTRGRGRLAVVDLGLELKVELANNDEIKRDEASVIRDLVLRGQVEDGVVTLLEIDCQVIKR